MTQSAQLQRLLKAPEAERLAWLKRLTPQEREEFNHIWPLWARTEQLPPSGNWQLWLILAGRGFGKTRAGAEWVRDLAERDPTARIALVGASLGEVRAVMVEGESGLLSISLPQQRPQFEPSLRRLVWPSGAIATLYSAGEPESLRGPQHSHACGPGPEGVLPEREPIPARRPAALRSRGSGERSAARPRKRTVLAGRPHANGKLAQSGRLRGLFLARPVAVPGTARRPASVQPCDRPRLALRGVLAKRGAPPPHPRAERLSILS